MNNLRIRELREGAGVTQSHIAEYLKITRAAYSMYEVGKRQMNYETLALLADYYRVSIDYLLGRVDVSDLLTEDERALIQGYRRLDARGRGNIAATMEYELSVSQI